MMLETAVTTPLLVGTYTVDQPVLAKLPYFLNVGLLLVQCAILMEVKNMSG